MNGISELKLENFRCFCDEQSGQVRPITLLVGENSTGKSSFLASYVIMEQCFKGPFINVEPEFNLDPFALGSFEDIAHNFGGTDEVLDEFRIGVSVGSSRKNNIYQVSMTFRQNYTSPHIHKILHNFGSNGYVEFERTSSGTKISIPGQSVTLDWPLSRIHGIINFSAGEGLIHSKSKHRSDGTVKGAAYYLVGDKKELLADTIQILTYLIPISRRHIDSVPSLMPDLRNVIAIAPVRSRPKRTYDPISELPNPEGDHTPIVLMRLNKTNKPYWEEFRKRWTPPKTSCVLGEGVIPRDWQNWRS